MLEVEYLAFLNELSEKRLGKSTIYNMGNTCYMNSVLQALLHNPYLNYYFMTNKYEEDVKKTSSKLNLLKQYVRLVNVFYEDNSKIRPHSLCKQIESLDDRYSGGEQNDAHEFLASIIDWLHDALSYEVNITSSSDIPTTEKGKLELQSIKEWDKFFSKEYSLIVDLCYGQYQTFTKCSNCSTINNRFEPFCYITLPVSEEIKDIYDGLDHMSKEEMLDKDNYVKCDKCNQNTVSSQKTAIWRTPFCLFIVLKRFSMTGKKINQLIDFPIEGLDLSSYVEGDDQETDSIYDLYSVVNHHGSHHFGHYTNISKNPDDNWIYIDDDKYRTIDDSSVISSNAYILCYVKRNFYPNIVKETEYDSCNDEDS